MKQDNEKNIVSFSTTASQEVDQDTLSITFSADDSMKDASQLQSALATKLKAALDIARAAAVPKLVEVRSGNFQIYPTYDDEGEVNGYNGSVDMIVSGTDMATIAGLTGLITTMAVASLSHSVSDDLRDNVVNNLTLRVIQMWRNRATEYVSAFNSNGYTLVNASISETNNSSYMRKAVASSAYIGGASGVPVEQEPGRETLSASVSGSIQLNR